jgi:hypothetical protein
VNVDADWDDESEQGELRIEAQVSCLGSNQSASINGFAFNDSSGSPRWLKFDFRHSKRGRQLRDRRDFSSELKLLRDF